eukprot:5286156-Prymnesium_polylepis.1
MKVLREKVHCRSSSSIHIDYNQPLAGGLSVHSTPARQIHNVSLPGGSSGSQLKSLAQGRRAARDHHRRRVVEHHATADGGAGVDVDANALGAAALILR